MHGCALGVADVDFHIVFTVCIHSGGFGGRALAPGDCVGRIKTCNDSGGAKEQHMLHRTVHDPLRDGGSSSTGAKRWELRVLPGAGDPSTMHDVDPIELAALVDLEFDVLPVRAVHIIAAVHV